MIIRSLHPTCTHRHLPIPLNRCSSTREAPMSTSLLTSTAWSPISPHRATGCLRKRCTRSRALHHVWDRNLDISVFLPWFYNSVLKPIPCSWISDTCFGKIQLFVVWRWEGRNKTGREAKHPGQHRSAYYIWFVFFVTVIICIVNSRGNSHLSIKYTSSAGSHELVFSDCLMIADRHIAELYWKKAEHPHLEYGRGKAKESLHVVLDISFSVQHFNFQASNCAFHCKTLPTMNMALHPYSSM